METTIVYWGYTSIMENRMERTIDYSGLNQFLTLRSKVPCIKGLGFRGV